MRSFRLAAPRFALVAALGSALAACGPNVALEDASVRTMLGRLANALIAKDHETVASCVDNFQAIGASNPVAAKKWETEEGRKSIMEDHYRALKLMLNDAHITDGPGVDRLLENTTVHITSATQGTATFEIAADKTRKRSAETVLLSLSKSREHGWRVSGYSRTLK